MKYLPIFALFLLFACCEVTNDHHQCFRVNFSDALPIQFWLNDCETYNESVPDGVHYKCFCHPWKCDDELKIQFTDAFDSSEVVETGNVVAITLPALSTWLTRSVDPDLHDWTLGANPTVNLPGNGISDVASSEYLYVSYAFVSGHAYTITINYNYVVNVSISNPRTSNIYILDSGFNILFSNSGLAGPGSGPYSVSVTFTATAQSSIIGLRHFNGSDVDITVTSASGTRTDIVTTYPDPSNYDLVVYNDEDEEIERLEFDAQLNETGFFYTHSASLIPSDHGICEQKIKFEVINITESPDEVVAKSDCILISDDQPDPTVLFEYSNNRNFAGLIYEDLSPVQTFQIRVPAVFFHEQFPEEDEAIELSDSKIINLNGVVRAQRLIDTAHMPYYMHRKMKLIFKHQTLLTPIDDKYWTKQDAYEIDEGDRRWPLKKAKCWLTERDFVQRNVV
jgi:hypothetical protein